MGTGTGTGIENVGGAIEGWVRKMAGKAAGAIGTPPLKGAGGVGDLIELVDAFELDGAAMDNEVEMVGGMGGEEQRGGAISGFDGDGKKEERERELRERFPPRGRVFMEEGKGKGKGRRGAT